MRKKEDITKEEWIPLKEYEIPKGEFFITSFNRNVENTKIVLENDDYVVEIFFEMIPVLQQVCLEIARMDTWGSVQVKYGKYVFENFFFEIKNSNICDWLIEESGGFYSHQDLKHYCIVTGEDVADIVSLIEPSVRVTKQEN